WADEHHARTGRWPRSNSGPIPKSGGETWETVRAALRCGSRGLNVGLTLPQFLAKHRGVAAQRGPNPPLAPAMILEWADQHHQRNGKWPTAESGVIQDAPGERWSAVARAMYDGTRGLVPGDSLARLLQRERGYRNRQGLSRLTYRQILAWADDYHSRTGTWPT